MGKFLSILFVVLSFFTFNKASAINENIENSDAHFNTRGEEGWQSEGDYRGTIVTEITQAHVEFHYNRSVTISLGVATTFIDQANGFTEGHGYVLHKTFGPNERLEFSKSIVASIQGRDTLVDIVSISYDRETETLNVSSPRSGSIISLNRVER